MPTKAKKSSKTSSKKPSVAAGPALVDLTPEEMKALPRPRDGFEAHVEPLLKLYQDHADELAIKGLNAADVRQRYSSYQTLGPLQQSAEKHLEMVSETRLLNGSQTWTAMLEIYAKAQAAGRTNQEIRRALADFAAFMKLGPRAKKPVNKP